MPVSLSRIVGAVAPLAAVLAAAPALAAVCHPNALGTRTLTLRGTVDGYHVDGSVVSVALRTATVCQRVVWNTATGAHRKLAGPCGATRVAASTAASLQASSGSVRVTVELAGRPDRPDTLRVSRRGRIVASWPLPARPRTLAVSADLAVFSATKGQGLFAVGLRAGRIAFLGPDRPGDHARLSARGVVFQDGENKRAAGEGRSILKFIPRSAIGRALQTSTRPLRTGSEIRSLAMDGPRVALALADTSAGARCDRVVYWNVAWPPAQRISAPSGPTCTPGPRAVKIGAIAIGGFRAAWFAQGGGATDRLVVGSPLCQEWVVGRLARGPGGDQLTGAAGDGATLAFAVTHHERELRGLTSVAVVDGHFRARAIASGVGAPVSLSVDHGSVAVLWSDGTVEIRGRGGDLRGRSDVGDARAVALEGSRLAVLRAARLDVYDIRSGARTRTTAIRRGVGSSLDVQYGVAAFALGRSAAVVDLDTGRLAIVGRAPTALVGVQIEASGVAFGYRAGNGGIARLVPFAAVERALGRVAI